MTARLYKTFTLAEAARLAKVAPSDVRRLILLGAARATGPGRRWTFADLRRLRDAVHGTISLANTTPGPTMTIARRSISTRQMAEVSAWVEEAWALEDRVDDLTLLDRARFLYEHVLECVPGHAAALVGLGNVHYRRGDREPARECYLAALRTDPHGPPAVQANYNLGVVLADERRFAQAEAFFRASLRLDPCFENAHFNLALTLEHLDHHAEAKAHWKRYLSLAPGAEFADQARAHLSADRP